MNALIINFSEFRYGRNWFVTILVPGEEDLAYTEAFTGSVSIRLKGHAKGGGPGSNWYRVALVRLHTRYRTLYLILINLHEQHENY